MFLGRYLGPMSAIVKEQDIPRLSLVDHPAQCGPNVGTSGHHGRSGGIGQDPDVAWVEPKPVQEHISHGMHIIYAPMQLISAVVVVAPNQGCQSLPHVLHFLF